MTPGVWAPAVTFAVLSIQAAVNGTDAINKTQVFTSLSLISLLCEPASALVRSVVDVFAAVGCSDRIQKFLVSPQRDYQCYTPVGGLWTPTDTSLGIKGGYGARPAPGRQGDVLPVVLRPAGLPRKEVLAGGVRSGLSLCAVVLSC